VIDKQDLKLGFWVATGVLAAFFIWGLLLGGFGKLVKR
jgi:hypothetical protein